ncbi:MAG: 3-deoxy-8-phosphooctulonate synthase [Pseudomonadota bacterium]
MSAVTPVQVGGVAVGGPDLVLIAGPCVLEGAEATLRLAEDLRALCARLDLPLIFKASFDKANRTSLGSFRGPGLEEGLAILARIQREVGLPITTDVHLPAQAAPVAEVADLLQVPAFLCRQTDLLVACAAAGRPVNVKKGQFVAPDAMGAVLAKLAPGRAILTERGTSFGHGDLVVDYRGLPLMRALGVPVCMDATHACQRPPMGGPSTGGLRAMIPVLARAAVAVGVDALFLEVHPDPEHAPCDGPNMLPLAELEPLLRSALAIRGALR